MQISIDDARHLVERVMIAHGIKQKQAAIIAEHIIDCELRGLGYGGLARVISIAERLQRSGSTETGVEIIHETPVSARLRGNDNLGYIVAHEATVIAIEKAKASGLSVVGANETWYTGMLSVYAEMASSKGLVTMIASNATPWVAPHGAVEGRFGTNPICFGFPSLDDPIIWDIGTSSIMHAEAVLAKRNGQLLDPGRAFDDKGQPTRDPVAALAGAFTPWGGHKGSGLGHVVQLLGILAGSPTQPPELADFGFLIVAMKPDLMMPESDYRAQVSAYADAVRNARPENGNQGVRMPFDRSAADRRRCLSEGQVDVPEFVIERLNGLLAPS